MSEVTYSRKNDETECVRYEKSRKTYLPHTHPNHLMIGYLEDGRVCITIDGESCIYAQGDEFRIMPNVLHEICDQEYSCQGQSGPDGNYTHHLYP